MLKKLLYNTVNLVKFNFKKDMKKTIIWLLSIVLIVYLCAVYYLESGLTQGELTIFLETFKNPAIVLICGAIPKGLPSFELLFSIEMTLFLGITIAIMNIFFVASNTRQDEENGRLELIRSLPTGRLSTLLSSVIQMLIINVILALGLTLALELSNISSTLAHSFHFGVTIGAFGFMFATISTIFAQVFRSNRSSTGAALAFLGLNFLIRGMTDIFNPNLSWLSPVAWIYKSEPLVNSYWLPILSMFLLSIFCLVISFHLNSLRDLDGSFFKPRAGKSTASKSLVKPFGFVFHSNKTTYISWIVAIILFAATFGVVFSDFGNFLANNSFIQTMFPGVAQENLEEQFLTMMGNMCMVFTTIPVVILIGRLHAEEKTNRLENILTKNISRHKILWSYLIHAIFASVLFTVLTISAMYIASNKSVNFNEVTKICCYFWSPCFFTLGLSILILGALPKLFHLSWIIIGGSFFITYFSEMLRLPNYIKNLSPFYHVSEMLVNDSKITPVLLLIALGLIFITLSFLFYRKRDINI